MDLLHAIIVRSHHLNQLLTFDTRTFSCVYTKPTLSFHGNEHTCKQAVALAQWTSECVTAWQPVRSDCHLTDFQRLASLSDVDLDDSALDPYAKLLTRYLPAWLHATHGHVSKAQRFLPQLIISSASNHTRLNDPISKDDEYWSILSLAHAWLLILQNEFDDARTCLAQMPSIVVPELTHHALVLESILHYLQGDESYAEAQLHEAKAYYVETQNDVAIAMIHFYMLAVQLASGSHHVDTEELNTALRTMEEQQWKKLPTWWHPCVVNYVLTSIIARPNTIKYAQVVWGALRSDLAQTKDGLSKRVPLASETSAQPRSALSTGTSSKEQQRQAVLEQMVNDGHLNEYMLSDLAHKLPHGTGNGYINPTMVGVFGLHLQCTTKRKIAERLDLSPHTVSAYLTKIYAAFDLGFRDYSTSKGRWLALYQKAKDAEYIL